MERAAVEFLCVWDEIDDDVELHAPSRPGGPRSGSYPGRLSVCARANFDTDQPNRCYTMA